ncbi:MAG TPA: NAD(P)/FAD-dependent oxidoreductase [Aeromicrobium sp.]|nr:NAD(P)/FAD-dependent oxidoreductase [Aeromicrobium sp.]
MYDTIVIGAGPAGLQAALTLGRMHRDVLVLDSGEYRNGAVEQAHNYATHDGRPPEEFRRLAREDLAEYTTVEVREAAVEAVAAGNGSFVVTIGETVEQGSTVVLATGVRDRLPDVPGLAQAWGREIAHCPFCHGHELAGRRVALDVQGPHAERLRSMLERIGADLIDVAGTVRGIERVAGGLVLTLDSGTERVDGMFIGPDFEPSAPFASQLGLDLNDSGCIAVDAFQATSLAGVFAAGDAAHVRELPMPMSSVLTAQAAGLVAGSACVQYLLTR